MEKFLFHFFESLFYRHLSCSKFYVIFFCTYLKELRIFSSHLFISERPIVLFISAWQSVRSFVRPSFVTITQSGDEKKPNWFFCRHRKRKTIPKKFNPTKLVGSVKRSHFGSVTKDGKNATSNCKSRRTQMFSNLKGQIGAAVSFHFNSAFSF